MKILRILPFISIITLWSTSLFAQFSHFESLSEQGQSELNAEQFNDAQQLFRRGYSMASKAGEGEWKIRFLFYLGNAYLVEANKISQNSSSAENDLAKNAAAVYQRVVKFRPESGSAKVNLARALTLAGDIKAADNWYQQAIAQKDGKELQFRQQYAAFLVKRDPPSAIKQLRFIVRAQPKSIKAHRMLMQIFRKPEYNPQLPNYLNEQVRFGEVLRAQNSALEFLLDAGLSAQIYDELVIVLADSLAQQHIAPQEFARSETALALKQIAEAQPHLRDCMRELSLTLSEGQSTNYNWWTRNTKRSSALSKLLRSVGDYYDQSKQPQRAERAYRDAVELRGAEDPKALTDLVEFYSKQGKLEKINDMSNTYETKLFQGKGQAYQEGDVAAIYEYHRTLASIYSYQASKTGDWGSSKKVNSAAFQLEHAYKTANKSKLIVPDAKLVNNLASSYEAKGKNKRANTVRIESAAKYKRAGNSLAATKVLNQVKQDNLSVIQRQKYQRVKALPVSKRTLKTPTLSKPSIERSNVSSFNSNQPSKITPKLKSYRLNTTPLNSTKTDTKGNVIAPSIAPKADASTLKNKVVQPKTISLPAQIEKDPG